MLRALLIVPFLVYLSCCRVKILPYPRHIFYGNNTLQISRCSIYFSLTDSAEFAKVLDSNKALILGSQKRCNKIGTTLKYPLTLVTPPTNAIFNPCTDESYELVVTETSTTLKANCSIGLARSLSTFYQLFTIDESSKSEIITFENLPIFIRDAPRFPYRGLMLDCSRHYLKVSTIKRVMDTMMLAKLNVLHLHLNDDDSFTMESKRIPGLAENASFSPQHIYHESDIKELIQYASSKGIKIVPEISMPAHIRAVGRYKLLNDIVTCYDTVTPYYLPHVYQLHGGPSMGVLDPTLNLTYEFAEKVIMDVMEYFGGEYIHLGGNDLKYSCWEKRESITQFMREHNISSYPLLATYFMQRINKIVQQQKKIIRYIDSNTLNLQYSKDEILQYIGISKDIREFVSKFPDNPIILSPFDYIDLSCGYGDKYGGNTACGSHRTWLKMYMLEPDNLVGEENRVLGAEALAWGDLGTDYDLDIRLWPRLAAFAERMWVSKVKEMDLIGLVERLDKFAEKLWDQGIPSEAITRQYCEMNTQECFKKWEDDENKLINSQFNMRYPQQQQLYLKVYKMQLNGIIFPKTSSSYTPRSLFGRILYIPHDPKEWDNTPPTLDSNKLYKTLKSEGESKASLCGTYSGPCIPCLYLPAKKPSTKVMIFFHGNAEDIASSRNLLKMVRRVVPIHIFAMEYKGYGIHQGDASAESILEDVDLLITYLLRIHRRKPSDLIIFGRSIGSGPACYAASKYEVHSLILMSAFTSIRAMAKKYVGAALQYLIAERFDNVECIKKSKCPVFIIHGKKDNIVPYTHSVDLWKHITAPSVFNLPPSMDHNSFSFFEDFIKPLKYFYETLGLDSIPKEGDTGIFTFPKKAFIPKKQPLIYVLKLNIVQETNNNGDYG
eukprot:TRINITY_DN135309_c0_g1_i1.p1 TRINITY_DN135309_c0_g1~~TRINITY_DN135309_c0_g1_i1.p1  ORF type:complete len:891 (+),score=44.51 TRINITY_DN135309_c0_g1_i1:940-3612(+)